MNGVITAEGYHRFVVNMWRNGADDPEKQVSIASHGLAGEAGEVAEKVKKRLADRLLYTRDDMLKELGDILFYVSMMAELHGASLENVMTRNIEKLMKRKADGTLVGNGDNR